MQNVPVYYMLPTNTHTHAHACTHTSHVHTHAHTVSIPRDNNLLNYKNPFLHKHQFSDGVNIVWMSKARGWGAVSLLSSEDPRIMPSKPRVAAGGGGDGDEWNPVALMEGRACFNAFTAP